MSERKPLLKKTIDPETVSLGGADTSLAGGADSVQGAAAADDSTSTTDGNDGGEAPAAQKAGQKNATVACRVCKADINVDGKTSQHVVKCSNCNEATPIRQPPSGKKYVRCPCNCLLICKVSSNRIACPRPNCKRVITLGSSHVGTATRAPPGTYRVVCYKCNEIFMFNTLVNSLAHCPHCKTYSAVGTSYIRKWAFVFFLLGLCALIGGIVLTTTTVQYAKENPATYASWGVAYLIALLLLLRCVYYVRLRVSRVDGPL